MAKAEASVEELVSMIERGELRLPEMQRRYVWRSPRVRDLLDSLYRGCPSGAILLWETDEVVPMQEFAITQQVNPFQSTRLLLDGQQRLTSLAAVIRGQPVSSPTSLLSAVRQIERSATAEAVAYCSSAQRSDQTSASRAAEWRGKYEGALVVIAVLVTISLLGLSARLPAPRR